MDSESPLNNMAPDQAAFTSVMESCPAKTVLSSVAGFAMGGLFGMFMSSVDYNPQSAYEGMNMRQQMAFTLRDMYGSYS
jgi:import inner membrane translocase subunit TIM22